MWSVVIVIAPPCVDDKFGVAQPLEEVFVEALVTQPSVEALNEAILHRLTRGNEVPGYAAVFAPFEHDVRGKLGAVIRDDHVGLSPQLNDLVELARHACTRDRRVDKKRQAFACAVIDHCKDPEPPAIV